jgi:hypothetical protein
MGENTDSENALNMASPSRNAGDLRKSPSRNAGDLRKSRWIFANGRHEILLFPVECELVMAEFQVFGKNTPP